MIRQSRWHNHNHCTNQQSILRKTTEKKKKKSLKKSTRMIHDIRNTITHTEWSIMRMIAQFIYQKKKRNIFWKHQRITERKKKTRWTTWNAERAKISHQVDEFSEKSDDKLKLLRTEWKEMKK